MKVQYKIINVNVTLNKQGEEEEEARSISLVDVACGNR